MHYTDFVGRSPWILFRSPLAIGGNDPTGGVEDKPFLYSHSSYFAEKPEDILVDEQGRNINQDGKLTGNQQNKNPYKKDYKDAWTKGKTHNQNTENPSAPILVKPR